MQITIDDYTAPSELRLIAMCLNALADSRDAVSRAETTTKELEEAPKARKPRAVKTEEAPAPTPTVTVTVTEEPVVPEPVAPSNALTLEEVRAELAVLSKQGKADKAKQLLANFGGTKLSDIPAEKYADLVAAAKELAQ